MPSWQMISAVLLLTVVVWGVTRYKRGVPAQLLYGGEGCYMRMTPGATGSVGSIVGGIAGAMGNVECKWSSSNPGSGWGQMTVPPNCANCGLTGMACACTQYRCPVCQKSGSTVTCDSRTSANASCTDVQQACSVGSDCRGNSACTPGTENSCYPLFCGDGVCDAWEVATGGSTPGSGTPVNCPADCKCGNSVVDSGEECDSGSFNGQNPGTQSYCSTTCKRGASSSSASSAVCGNGVKEAQEECDAGAKNVPLSLANISWEDLQERGEDGDPALSKLEESGCLEGCTLAACSDTEDNDDDSAADNADPGCHIGSCADCEVLQTAYLPGRNSEDNPCTLEDTTYDEDQELAYEGSVFLGAMLRQITVEGEECEVLKDGCPKINGKKGICVAWGTEDEPDGKGRCTQCKDTGDNCGANWHCCSPGDLCVRQQLQDSTTYNAHCRTPDRSPRPRTPPCTGGQANNGGFPIFVLPPMFPTSSGNTGGGTSTGGGSTTASSTGGNASGGGTSTTASSTAKSSSQGTTQSSAASSVNSSSRVSSSGSADSSLSSSEFSSESLSSSSSMFSSSFGICGDGKTEGGEECDNGSLCKDNPYISCVTAEDCKRCMIVGGSKRCQGLPSGKLCTVDTDCADSGATCAYNTLIGDPTCGADCRRVRSSSSSSSVSSSSIYSSLSKGTSSSSRSSSRVPSSASSSSLSSLSSLSSSSLSSLSSSSSSSLSSLSSLSSSSLSSSVQVSNYGLSGFCGDGTRQAIEQCDDGNTRDGDGCSASCLPETNQVYLSAGFCGNSIAEALEECDDGNTRDGDGCSSTCLREQASSSKEVLVAAASLCGNGVLETPEECDDTNRRSGDGCNDACLLEIGICGDGKVQQLLGEQCEQSTHNSALPYGCRNCRFFSTSCGDGKTDPGEECDKGPLNSTSANADCRPDCSLSRCGDGILDSAEICDDGNRRAGDGCDVYCKVEDGKLGVTVIASDAAIIEAKPITQQLSNQQQIQFPYAQPYPYAQLPFASLQPLMQQMPTTTQSGPAAVIAIGAGAAAGFSWMRRRKK